MCIIHTCITWLTWPCSRLPCVVLHYTLQYRTLHYMIRSNTMQHVHTFAYVCITYSYNMHETYITISHYKSLTIIVIKWEKITFSPLPPGDMVNKGATKAWTAFEKAVPSEKARWNNHLILYGWFKWLFFFFFSNNWCFMMFWNYWFMIDFWFQCLTFWANDSNDWFLVLMIVFLLCLLVLLIKLVLLG